MTREQIDRVDILVVGAGVTGLTLAWKAAELGLRTAVFDAADTPATGVSIRNEGWLHSGSYHAQSIQDADEAERVARRCRYGYDQFRTFAPECVETAEDKCFALVRDPHRVQLVVERWGQAAVPHTPVSVRDLRGAVPEVNCSSVAAAYLVTDVGINTRMLYQKLITRIRMATGDIVMGMRPVSTDSTTVVFSGNGSRRVISARSVVFAVGYRATTLLEQLYGIRIQMRTWQSHIAITPRLARHAAFFLEPGEATLMNHRAHSVLGLNEDARPCDPSRATPSVDSNGVVQLLAAAGRLLNSDELFSYQPVACIKSDLRDDPTSRRTVDAAFRQVSDGVYLASPGKMTEAPFLADQLLQDILSRTTDWSVVTPRPFDLRQSALRGHNTVIRLGDRIAKLHRDLDSARRERMIAEAFAANGVLPVRIPRYLGTATLDDGCAHLLMEPVHGASAVGNADEPLLARLVDELALFHELFRMDRTSPAPTVLYRDAILSNYIIHSEGHTHLDFASCTRIVHCFDDLALLLNPAWTGIDGLDVKRFVDAYTEARSKWSNAITTTLKGLNVEPPSVSELKAFYSSRLEEMAAVGVSHRDAPHLLEGVSWDKIDARDYANFAAYRSLRAEYYKNVVWRQPHRPTQGLLPEASPQ